MRRTTPISPQTAAAIAARRRQCGLTQNDVALEIGLSEGSISKIETARVPLTSETATAIEQAIQRLAGEKASVIA